MQWCKFLVLERLKSSEFNKLTELITVTLPVIKDSKKNQWESNRQQSSKSGVRHFQYIYSSS